MSIQTTLESHEVVVCAMLAVAAALLTTVLFVNLTFSAPIVA